MVDLGYNGFPRRKPAMVKHGALSKSHVYHLLRSMTRAFAALPSLF